MEITVQTEPPSEILQDENCKTVMNYNQDNKRFSYRIKINSPITLKTKSFAEIPSQSQNAQTINLSEGGIGISFDAEVKLPSPLLIEFSLMNTPLQFQGEVRWNKIFDDGKYYCGVHFLDKDEQQEDILKRFLFTNNEYILNLIKDLKTEDRDVSGKIESFFRRDVKEFVENLISFEEAVKEKSLPDDFIQKRVEFISEEICKRGDTLEKIIGKGLLIKKIKESFRSLIGHWVYKSKFMERAYKRPCGYRGDYYMLEMIYNNQLISEGLGIYFDRWFLDNPYAIAVRNRKEKIKESIRTFLKETALSSINVLNIASGPCREIKELLDDMRLIKKELNFTCVDFDEEAINFSKNRLKSLPENLKIEFLKDNVTKLIDSKKYTKFFGKQNLIYSTGLTDYLPDRVLKNFIFFAFSVLYPNGKLILTHKDKDKYSPVPLDWVVDWIFEPRNVSDLIRLAENSGINNYSADIEWEDSNKTFFLILTKKG
ncbi:MAG: PilZ domain-containing protein [Nitrospirota bacterium]